MRKAEKVGGEYPFTAEKPRVVYVARVRSRCIRIQGEVADENFCYYEVEELRVSRKLG